MAAGRGDERPPRRGAALTWAAGFAAVEAAHTLPSTAWAPRRTTWWSWTRSGRSCAPRPGWSIRVECVDPDNRSEKVANVLITTPSRTSTPPRGGRGQARGFVERCGLVACGGTRLLPGERAGPPRSRHDHQVVRRGAQAVLGQGVARLHGGEPGRPVESTGEEAFVPAPGGPRGDVHETAWQDRSAPRRGPANGGPEVHRSDPISARADGDPPVSPSDSAAVRVRCATPPGPREQGDQIGQHRNPIRRRLGGVRGEATAARNRSCRPG